MKVAVVMNSKAGALVGGSPDEMARRIEQLFAAAGAEAHVVVAEGPNLEEAIRRFRDSDVDAVVVAGGDGSVDTAAKALAGSGRTLGVLPMGTFNLFARDLRVPLRLEEAVPALVGGHVQQVDTAEVNGKLFLCNSVMGLMPSLVDARESIRGKSLFQRLRDMAVAVGRLVRRYPRLTVTVDLGKGAPDNHRAISGGDLQSVRGKARRPAHATAYGHGAAGAISNWTSRPIGDALPARFRGPGPLEAEHGRQGVDGAGTDYRRAGSEHPGGQRWRTVEPGVAAALPNPPEGTGCADAGPPRAD